MAARAASGEVTPFEKRDMPWIIGAFLALGVVVLLMWGLSVLPGDPNF